MEYVYLIFKNISKALFPGRKYFKVESLILGTTIPCTEKYRWEIKVNTWCGNDDGIKKIKKKKTQSLDILSITVIRCFLDTKYS